MRTDYHIDFGPFGGKVWLNCAHQGPLSRVAAEEAREAIAWKVRPFELTAERFAEVPARLRGSLGRLLGVHAEEIILGNFLSHKDRDRNRLLHARLKEQGVEAAYRRGQLRLAPHLYNTADDIDRALAALHAG